MATMIVTESTGEREFRVPFMAPPAGAPYVSGSAELVIKTHAGRAYQVLLRFLPADFEFQAKLPRLATALELPAPAHEISFAATGRQAVVIYEADGHVVFRLPPDLDDLPALEAFLIKGPNLFDIEDYAPIALEFESLPDEA